MRDVGEQRVQDDERRLRCRKCGEERNADGPWTVPHQTMIGTVPPSALHAAPVTYEHGPSKEDDD